MLTNFLLGLAVVASFLGISPIGEPSLGATIATTSISDTIGTFRTNVNTSLENLNTQLESVSSTIGSYGTIAVENSPLRIAAGGTGTTTLPSDGQVLSANGTSTAWKTVTGSGGVTITTSTTGINIGSVAFDEGGTYDFTGGNTFSSGTTAFTSPINVSNTLTNTGSTTLSGTTTVSGQMTISGSSLSISAPITISTSTTFNGNVSFSTSSTAYTNAVMWQYLGASTTATVATSTTATAAIIRAFGTISGCSSVMGGELTIFKTGKTGGALNFAECNSVNNGAISATWSGNTITLSGSGDAAFTINSGSTIYWFK